VAGGCHQCLNTQPPAPVGEGCIVQFHAHHSKDAAALGSLSSPAYAAPASLLSRPTTTSTGLYKQKPLWFCY
jgi:hypothetical protein